MSTWFIEAGFIEAGFVEAGFVEDRTNTASRSVPYQHCFWSVDGLMTRLGKHDLKLMRPAHLVY